ncbi:hypothetical protein ACJJID_06945 [Microbulbifer sp. CnH-101-G]|uniref:hypothetical protein n=1 Tax=Microbulbifer sp. CnH-101-G TaxID=3243393 RepID=UPI00403A6E20
MNHLTCHCGAIHYKLFNSSALPRPNKPVDFVEASNPVLIEDPSKQLNTYTFKYGPIKKHAFCNQCGATIYQIDNQGQLQHAVHPSQAYRADYRGILNFGF